jgi:tRNA A37 methylthiotransferase MiaB
MPGQVPPQVMKERNRILRDIAMAKKMAFMQSFVGGIVEAITLNVYEDGCTEALTDNYLKLRLRGQHEPNRWLNVQVESVEGDVLLGSM